MVAKQLWIKLTKVPRKIDSPKDVLIKAVNAYFFVYNSYRRNADIAERCQRLLAKLTAQGTTNISLYGTGDIAELLCKLSTDSSVKIRSVYDDFPDQEFRGFSVRPIREWAMCSDLIVIADVVGIEEKSQRLRRIGVDPEKIVNL